METADRISDELSLRLDALAKRTSQSRARIIENALSQGRSLAWQEQWAAGVRDGIADAEAGRFATDDEIFAIADQLDADRRA